MYDWSKLLLNKRFGEVLESDELDKPDELKTPRFARRDFRVEQECDYDRILYSAPFRRMGDKTQVFPLERIDSIRTRLTHSCEVASLARSLGLEIATLLKKKRGVKLPDKIIRRLPSTLAAVALGHDIGNPPFGHRGEEAIRSWFKRNEGVLFVPPCNRPDIAKDVHRLTSQHKKDFLQFEGNAQTLRVVTKFQLADNGLGLDLTLGTLAALMKYVAASDGIDKAKPALKKIGYFASEQPLVERLRDEIGLDGISRHPLALVMEACDDIAYSVLDAEDAIKKGLVSLNDLMAWLRSYTDDSTEYLCDFLDKERRKFNLNQMNARELQDLITLKFRSRAIHLMVCAVAESFNNSYDKIMDGTYNEQLIETSRAEGLCKALKEFDKESAFDHSTVLEIELDGYNKLNRLMDFLWIGISKRKEYETLKSDRASPFAVYAYSKISEGCRRIFEGNEVGKRHNSPATALPFRYKEMQLLTDMVSGMTDKFCINLHDDLQKHYCEMHPVNTKFV